MPLNHKRRTILAVPANILKRNKRRKKIFLPVSFPIKNWKRFQKKLIKKYDIESKKDNMYCLQIAVRFAIIFEKLESKN